MLPGIKGLCHHTCPILFLINSNFVSWKGKGGRGGEERRGKGEERGGEGSGGEETVWGVYLSW